MDQPASLSAAPYAVGEVDLGRFRADGFVLIPSVLAPSEVRALRDFCTGLFAADPQYPGDNMFARYDIFARYPETGFLLSHGRVLSALRALLGDEVALVPEAAVHDSRYGAWHKDTSEMERHGLSFHREPSFLMVQCALYLQDNDEHGGGLDVQPGSHRLADTTKAHRHTLRERVAFKLGLLDPREVRPPRPPDAHSIPSKSGDMVIFDMKLNHMATQPEGKVADIPPEKRKFALFFICSANAEHARRYVAFVADQPHYDYLAGGDHVYPDEVRQLAQEANLILI